jgi:phospholipid/cholesterol/gamma-HCH transport system ATP-binding protein
VLEVRDLVAGYGDKTILDGVSLTVDEGEIVVVLGGSGSGKSTLLRCVVGLLAPISGTVTIDGRDIHKAHPKERDEILRGVGMAFQSAALLNSLTCADNVALPIEEHWRLDHETARMVARMRLASVGLADAADALPSELSGGMRKRAGLARALALDPKLLLFDEPSAGLDPITSVELDELIVQVNRSLGTTIVVVSHELPSIFTIATRCIMLDPSTKSIIAEGPPLELREKHPDPRVHAFFNRQAQPS